MDANKLINPFKLFGLDSKSTLDELRKAYYKMALICHPDKGGTKEDMDIVYKAYIYIKNQLENCKEEKEYDKLEEDFKDFCQKQTDNPPPFLEIWELSDDKRFHDEFNKKFMKLHHHDDIEKDSPFKDGYGELMDKSEYHNSHVNNYDNNIKGNTANKFNKDIIEYKEPQALPDTYGKYYNFNVKNLKDYSEGNMSDYMMSFTEPEKMDGKIVNRTLEDIKKEREKQDKLI